MTVQDEKEKELRNPKKTKNAEIFKVPAPSRLKAISTLGSLSSTSSAPKPTSAQLRGGFRRGRGRGLDGEVCVCFRMMKCVSVLVIEKRLKCSVVVAEREKM